MKFDAASCTVLALCTLGSCAWHELVLDAEVARRAALDHLWRVHPDAEGAQRAVQQWLARRRAAGVR